MKVHLRIKTTIFFANAVQKSKILKCIFFRVERFEKVENFFSNVKGLVSFYTSVGGWSNLETDLFIFDTPLG